MEIESQSSREIGSDHSRARCRYHSLCRLGEDETAEDVDNDELCSSDLLYRTRTDDGRKLLTLCLVDIAPFHLLQQLLGIGDRVTSQ